MTRALALAVITLLGVSCGVEPILAPTDVEPNAPPILLEPEAEDAEPPTVEVSLGEPLPLRDGPPYPIVLVHGFSGFTSLGPLEYFFGVKEDLESRGYVVYTPALPPYNDSADRAATLAAFVDEVIEETNKAKVHLVGHSQGGVDCRRLVSGMGYASKVASLITVASPHRGTPLADAAMDAPEGLLNPAGRFLAWMIGAIDDPPNETEFDDDDVQSEGWDADLHDAMHQMTTAGMAAFNIAHPNPDEVPIFSVAGYSNLQGAPAFCDGALWETSSRVDSLDPLLIGSALMISGLSFRHNDGVVPTDSHLWGTLLGCVPADHLDEVGQIGDLLPNLVSGFSHLELFADIAAFARALE